MLRTLIALLAVAALPALAHAQDAPGEPKHGFQLFMADGCYQCHGTVGQGGQGPTLGRLKLPPPAFQQLVRRPAGAMPAYSEKVLPAADLADIYAYLKSVPAPPEHRPTILNDH